MQYAQLLNAFHASSSPFALLSRLDVRAQMPIKGLALDRHIDLVEGVLHDVVRIQLVDLADDDIHVRLVRLGEEQELRARQSLKAL